MNRRRLRNGLFALAFLALGGGLVWNSLLRNGFVGEFKVESFSWFTARRSSTKPKLAANCAPMWPLSAIIAKYPPNANPGFNSPEEVTAFLEKRWTLENIKRFTIPERRHNDAYQNLVADTPEIWAGRLYCDKATGFDSIEWYATVENSSAKERSIKEYSLQAIKGKDLWLLEIGDQTSVQKAPVAEPNIDAPFFVGRE